MMAVLVYAVIPAAIRHLHYHIRGGASICNVHVCACEEEIDITAVHTMNLLQQVTCVMYTCR